MSVYCFSPTQISGTYMIGVEGGSGLFQKEVSATNVELVFLTLFALSQQP